MKIQAGEAAIISYALQTNNEGGPRQYALPELIMASEIYKEIKKCVKDGQFADGEIKITSEHKVFITTLIDAKKWLIGDADSIISLKKKLA